MPITAAQFDQLVVYSLRIELLNGRVLFYRIDTGAREYLINKLGTNCEGSEENKDIDYLWFETSLERQVMINTNEIVRVTFLIDYFQETDYSRGYYDNFEVVEKDTSLVPKQTPEGDIRMYVLDEEFLPQAIIYHKGKSPDNNYDTNPILYFSLNEGCLDTFALELDNAMPLRQFINLVDNDGEETFIPLRQIIVMEFDNNLLYDVEKESGFESDFDFDEEQDETGGNNIFFAEETEEILHNDPGFSENPVEAFNFDLLFDKQAGQMFDRDFLFDEEPGENPRPDDKPGKEKGKDDFEK